jgi:alanine dehydrogenase
MIIAVPAEKSEGERRVALVPHYLRDPSADRAHAGAPNKRIV